MTRRPQVQISETLRHTCIACGRCCRSGLEIWCPPADRERLSAIDWAAKNPALSGQPLFERGARGWRLALDEAGACRFLLPDGRCLMHRELGYGAKLLTCRLYPLTFTRRDGAVRVGLLHSCPAVVEGTGERLSAQAEAVGALLAEWERTVGAAETPPPVFVREHAISWEDAETFERVFIAALADESLAWPRRLLRAAELVEALGAWDGEAFAAHVTHAAARADDRARHSGLSRPKLAWGERFMLRQWLALCAGLGGSRGRWTGRVRGWFRFFRGSGRMGSMFGDATFAGAAAVSAHSLPDADGRLFTEWAVERVRGGRYFGGDQWGLGVAAGARLVIVSAAVAVWLAKAFAAAGGRSAVTRDDAREAVMLAERTFGHLGGMPLARFGGALQALEAERGAERAVLAAVLPPQR